MIDERPDTGPPPIGELERVQFYPHFSLCQAKSRRFRRITARGARASRQSVAGSGMAAPAAGAGRILLMLRQRRPSATQRLATL